MSKEVKIGLVGAGYWGKNLLRNFVNCPLTTVVALCDSDTRLAKSRAQQYAFIQTFPDIKTMLSKADVDAVVIATPVHTHYDLAMTALKAGKHVLVEKPISLDYATAMKLTKAAARKNLTFMCDHTFCYSGPVRRIRDIIRSGILGNVLSITSVRTNLGLFQKDVNVLWDLAPHDLSICEYVLGEGYNPVSVNATGVRHPQSSHVADAHLTVNLKNDTRVTIHNSWLAPQKIRQMTIVGTNRMLLWDDLVPTEKIKIYHKNMKLKNEEFVYTDEGSIAPIVDATEPLLEVATDFARCIQESAEPVATGTKAAQIVQILELANESLATEQTVKVNTNQ
jgi:predicted dehydrogenase